MPKLFKTAVKGVAYVYLFIFLVIMGLVALGNALYYSV